MTFFTEPRQKVLVVEAARGLREVVGAALSNAGYAIALAASPNEALTLLEASTFDLILTDLFAQPHQEQLGSVARLRVFAQPTPVGILTGWQVPKEAAAQQGFAWVIQKPFAIEELLNTIQESLRSPFSPEQSQQVELIKRYLGVLAAGEWDALRALCSPMLCYYPPRAGAFAPLRVIRGLEAYLEYAELARNLYVEYRLDHCVVFLQQQRFVTHFTSSWRSASGERVSMAGTMLCRFAGERLDKIAVFMNRARLERLLASTAGTVHPLAERLPQNILHSQARKPPEQRPRATSAPPAPVTPQRIGERVHAARFAARLTQEELAGQEYSKSYVSAVERGKMTPSFHALGLLAERLGVTRSFLLGEDLPPPSSPTPDVPVIADQQTAVREALEQLLGQERYEEALALCGEYGRLDWMSEVRTAYAQCLAAQGRYEDAYQQLAQACQKQTSGR